MSIYELTKSDLYDLYDYHYGRKRGFVYRFSVAAFTDNKAKFYNNWKSLIMHALMFIQLRIIGSEDINSSPKHALTLHQPPNFDHISFRISTLHHI